MNRTKLVTIESYGRLAPLGGINGPISTPCNIDLKVIISLVNAGKVVYEVNPLNKSEKVRLTLSNVSSTNFNTTVKEPVKPVTPKVNVVKSPVKNDNHHYDKKHNKKYHSNHNDNIDVVVEDKPVEIPFNVVNDDFISNKKS